MPITGAPARSHVPATAEGLVNGQSNVEQS